MRNLHNKNNRRRSYHQPSSLSETNKTPTQESNQKLRPIVKVYKVNEQGDCEGDAHWDVVENSIGPINYTELSGSSIQPAL